MKAQVSAMLSLFALAQQCYSFPIQLLETHSATFVEIARANLPYDGSTTNFSRTKVSTASISDDVYDTYTGSLAAEAQAGLFTIFANTPTQAGVDPLFANSHAGATNIVRFSPLTSQTATLSINFSGAGHWQFASGGILSLFNLTTGTEVWNYHWDGWLEGTIAGVPLSELNPVTETITVKLDTDFHFGELYEMTMGTRVGATQVDPVSPSISLKIFGLEPIPEPSVGALVALPFGMLFYRRWPRKRWAQIRD